MKLLLPLILAALPAISSSITYDPSIPRLFQNIEISAGGNVLNVNAGQIGVRFDGIAPALMYCADPLTWLLVGPTPVTPVPDTAFSNGGRLAWLYNTYNGTITQGWQAAALQLAIWEVILDYSPATANTNAQVVALAGSMLAASAGQSSTGLSFWVPDAGPGVVRRYSTRISRL